MEKILLLRTACAMLLASAGSIAWAQQHQHHVRHGGQILHADGYHIEVVASGDEYAFHLTDSTGTAVPTAGITGTAYIRYVDRTTANVPIEPHPKKGHLRAVLTNPSAFTMVVSLKVEGAFITAQYESGERSFIAPAPQHGANDGHNH